MSEENSEKTGSQPDNKSEVKTDVKAESSPEKKDVKSESSADKPWNQDPRFKEDNETFKIGKSVKALMDANKLQSVDDLNELLDSGKKVYGKKIDLDRIEEAFARSEKLEKYEKYWAQQDELNKRAQERPEDTIARLEAELRKKQEADEKRETSKKEQESAKQALQSYDREVQTLVKELDVPKEQQGFILEFFGVGNPFNEIDITDKKAIKKLISDGLKKKEAYDQAVIQSYIKGKTEVPKVGSTSGSAPMGDKPKIMLKDARRALHDAMQKVTGG